jgi:hypothetical protein
VRNSKLQQRWQHAWQEALAVWSRFTQLGDPRWCFTKAEEKKEQLTSSFAMIRLNDHAVVISLRQVVKLGLTEYPREILAHEIGHHVYAPADLSDNARLLARIRAALGSWKRHAGMVANLYTDLLINNRLQRDAGLDMAGVYRVLKQEPADDFWNLYMRIYEVLWSLPSGTLAQEKLSKRIDNDAVLGARLVRTYARGWLNGAGRFAMLLLPYLEASDNNAQTITLAPWLDTAAAGEGDVIPDGIAEIDEQELEGAIHPSEDEELTGIGGFDEGPKPSTRPGKGTERERTGGVKNHYRDPSEYLEIMKSLGVDVPLKELVVRYYRERAIPHLIRFPTRETQHSSDPLPESLGQWDIGSPISQVDWVESVVRSPETIIPGVTTVERLYGTTEGGMPEEQPLHLYLGVDCSGSMGNPAQRTSYPVLAGAVIVVSALRSGAKVMVCLSGEPGEYTNTDGFVRSETEALNVLTSYLGTGYAFGILRLKETFLDGEPPTEPTHILVVTDSDLFYMLDEVKDGWDIARHAAEIAGGGATAVLELPSPGRHKKELRRLNDCGWDTHIVTSMEEVVAFGRAFSRARYGDELHRVERN